MDFIVKVFKGTDVIGAQVNVTDNNDSIESISITDTEDLQDIVDQITRVTENYISNNNLKEVLENDASSTKINATHLGGRNSKEYTTVGHTHEYAPTSHSDSNGKYGIGNKNEFGHVRIINDLSEEIHIDGRALSAYQGKILDQKINQIQTDRLSRGGFIIVHDNFIQKNEEGKFILKCSVYYSDGYPVDNKELEIHLHQENVDPVERHIEKAMINNGEVEVKLDGVGEYTPAWYHTLITLPSNRKINKFTTLSLLP